MGRLFEQAIDDLERGDYSKALAKAQKMRKQRYSGAFEVEARVWLAQDQLEKALAVLQEAPVEVFILQLMRATTLSELGRYSEAREVYARARQCPGADASAVDYNEAVTLMMEGQLAAALRLCPTADDPACLGLRVSLLTQLGEYQQAGALARKGGEGPVFCEALAFEAWYLKGQRAEALELAERALALDSGLQKALELVRELTPCDSRRFRLTIQGTWHEPVGKFVPQFYRNFLVEAPSQAEALERARCEEPEPVRASIGLESLEDLGEYPAGRGIIWRSGHLFFPPDK